MKNTPGEFVTTVRFVCIESAHEAPDEASPSVHTRTKKEHTTHEREVIHQEMFNRMSINTGDTSGVDELVVLLMEHLIHWKIFVFAVENSVHEMKSKIVTYNQD